MAVFSPRYSWNYILNRNLTQRWTKSGPFFQNQGTFFIYKKGQENSPPLPLVARLKAVVVAVAAAVKVVAEVAVTVAVVGKIVAVVAVVAGLIEAVVGGVIS